MGNDSFDFFRFSYSGDLYPESRSWGLANIVYGTKALQAIGALETLDESRTQGLIRGMLQFQTEDGLFYDPLLTGERSFGPDAMSLIGNKKCEEQLIRIAETRQTYSALALLGAAPEFPADLLPKTVSSVQAYLEALDWTRPWRAGSHFSHLLYFFSLVSEDQLQTSKETLVNAALSWMKKLQSSQDGSWYIGKPSAGQRINGAMKVITGLHAIGLMQVPHAQQLIDLVLSESEDQGACFNLDAVFVLASVMNEYPEYRKAEIDSFFWKHVSRYQEYYYPKLGGFSASAGKAREVLYGKRITEGRDEPDIHGTVLYLIALANIEKTLPLGLNLKTMVH